MCARCPTGERNHPPVWTWPVEQSPPPGIWDRNPPDYGRPDYGKAPPRTLFGLAARKVKPFKYGRWPRWAHRDDDA